MLPDNLHDEPLLPVAMAGIAMAALCGVLLYLADRADQIEQAHLPAAPPEFVAATPHLAARAEPTPCRPGKEVSRFRTGLRGGPAEDPSVPRKEVMSKLDETLTEKTDDQPEKQAPVAAEPPLALDQDAAEQPSCEAGNPTGKPEE